MSMDMCSVKTFAEMTPGEFSDFFKNLTEVSSAVYYMNMINCRIMASSLLLVSHKTSLPVEILYFLTMPLVNFDYEKLHASLVKAHQVSEGFVERVGSMMKLQQSVSPPSPTLWVD